MEKLVFIDVESVRNVLPRTLLQIGAIAVDDSFDVLEEFETKIQFDDCGGTLPPPRNKHYCPELWNEQAVPAQSAAKAFADFLRRHASFDMINREGKCYQLAQLVAHNAERFDGPIIHEWFDDLGLYCPARRMTYCTKQRAMWFVEEDHSIQRPANYRLRTLCEHFGIDWNAKNAHDALFDVRATVELYRTLMKLLAMRCTTSHTVLASASSRVVRFSPWPSRTGEL